MSKAFIIVGATGCGKTFFTKNTLLKSVHREALHIFDTNNEYQEIYPYPFDADIDYFLEKAYRLKNAVILIEDATAFLSNRGRSDMLTKIMVAKRHTGNTIILLFHSLRAIPKYLMDISTDIVIFKTNDDPKFVKGEFKNERLLMAWQAVQENASKNPFYRSQPPPKNTIPSMTHFSLY